MNKQDQVIEYVIKWINKNPEKKFIPSENALTIRFGFSRNTIRTALRILVDRDILIPVKGRGYISNESNAKILKSFSKQYDGVHSSVFVKYSIHNEKHKILECDGYAELVKVRYKGNDPFILTIQHLPLFLFNEIKNYGYQESLYEAIEESGEKISFAKKTTTYVKTPQKVKYFLPSLKSESLLLESKTYNKNKRIIEYSNNYYYPEKFKWSWIEKTVK